MPDNGQLVASRCAVWLADYTGCQGRDSPLLKLHTIADEASRPGSNRFHCSLRRGRVLADVPLGVRQASLYTSNDARLAAIYIP